MKLVTNAAVLEVSLIGEVRTEAFGQKENMGKGEYGKGTFRADQFCILDTYGQWLGMNVLLRLNDDWLFVPDEGSCGKHCCAYADVM